MKRSKINKVTFIEAAVIFFLVLVIFTFYYLNVFAVFIDFAVVIIGTVLFVNSVGYIRGHKKYNFHHLVVANLYLVITAVHLFRFIDRVII